MVNEGIKGLLEDYPTTRRLDKVNNGRCLKVVDRDINLSLGEDLSMGEVADIAKKVLVGGVRGQNYTVERLHLSTLEIWGTLLKEMPTIRVLTGGWFTLRFHREEYTY